MLEFINGAEQHSSRWGKYYVKGIEKHAVKEDHPSNRRDNHHNYQFFVADLPVGALFTIFEQNGNKRGTEDFSYAICQYTGTEQAEHYAVYGDGFVTALIG